MNFFHFLWSILKVGTQTLTVVNFHFISVHSSLLIQRRNSTTLPLFSSWCVFNFAREYFAHSFLYEASYSSFTCNWIYFVALAAQHQLSGSHFMGNIRQRSWCRHGNYYSAVILYGSVISNTTIFYTRYMSERVFTTDKNRFAQSKTVSKCHSHSQNGINGWNSIWIWPICLEVLDFVYRSAR